MAKEYRVDPTPIVRECAAGRTIKSHGYVICRGKLVVLKLSGSLKEAREVCRVLNEETVGAIVRHRQREAEAFLRRWSSGMLYIDKHHNLPPDIGKFR